MTFTEALAIWRNEVVVDLGTDRWSDAEGLRLLGNAASEVAAMLGFPKYTEDGVTLSIGATSFAAPVDLLDVELDSLFVHGVQVKSAPWHLVNRKRFMSASPYPKYFSYDPEHGGSIIFAPPVSRAAVAGQVEFRYVAQFPRTVIGADQVWDGLFPQWHHIVPIRAGENTYREIELYERANEFAQVFTRELQAFAMALGKTNIANATVPPENRNDPGSVTG
jgi:hypothetical protein